jgi:prolyl-tRNA synthetase
MLKTVVYKTSSGKYFSIIIRWDLDINEIKVRKFIQKKYGEWFIQATEEDLKKLRTIRGFVTPLKDSKLKMDNYADYSLLTAKNFFWGANALAKSTKNVNISDLDILEYSDFNKPKEWFTSNNTKWEKLTFKKASEVWNIFYLWDKYSKPFWLSFSDKNNKTIDKIEMWCYWIWVSRLMWVMAEYFMTKNWITWPENIAPYDYYIIIIWKENISKWEELASILEKEWKSVILDDRLEDVGFGQKAWDCELYWVPNRIVISSKTIEQGWYELLTRWEETKIVKF